ncbi:MAG: oxygen-independent coproporphyrinogen III oxidase [Oceanospirillaceae bacterium]|jgi:oxygen-independent coproporphyrinogen-3 oxidase|nr:oxygen-independent coproporphyrinogen III oxidase [Oceanospirillaceae bacterium]MBT4444017.1 oxygen-independent coproporphyrinogen III oxidase [Oceanospirillaceae bacterium]
MTIPTPAPALIEKYGLSGPRYTSYPSALQFSENFSDESFLQDLANEQGHIAVYIHLPFCRSMCWFCGCTKIITRNQASADLYLDYLAKEMQMWAPHLQNKKVAYVHFGGGTPNFLTVEQIDRLNALIKCYLPLANEVEISVELSPDQLQEEQVNAFARMGAKRASIGIQDTNAEVQVAINRLQPQSQNVAAMNWLRKAGFSSINVDLIYGLPHQTASSFEMTLEQVLQLDPDRIALFNYAHVPWFKPTQKVFASDVFPSTMMKLKIFQASCARLQSAGYTYIGLDHFAKQDDELAKAWQQGTIKRDFQGYSVNPANITLGMGMSSVSQSRNAYRQNHKELKAYTAALDAQQLPVATGIVLTKDDQMRRQVINQVMCQMSVDFDQLGIDAGHCFTNEMDDVKGLIDDGIVVSYGNGFKVTALGRLFLRNVAMQFDAYRQQQADRCSATL